MQCFYKNFIPLLRLYIQFYYFINCASQDHVHLPLLHMSQMQLPLHFEGIPPYTSYFGRFFFSRKISLRLIEIQYFCWFLLKLCSTDARMPLFSTKAVSKVLLAKNGTNYTDFELTSSIVYSDIYWICCHTLLIDNSWKAALYIYTKDSMFVYTNHCKRVKLWNIIRV